MLTKPEKMVFDAARNRLGFLVADNVTADLRVMAMPKIAPLRSLTRQRVAQHGNYLHLFVGFLQSQAQFYCLPIEL